MGKNTRIFEPIRHVFSEDEKRGLGEELAQEVQKVLDLRADKAMVVSELGSQIKTGETRIAEVSLKLNQGFEIRDVECAFMMDTPRVGMKTLIRVDNSADVRIEAMTLNEQQESFSFPDSDEPDGKTRGAGDR
jgi:hypothetical protein